jgi:hypothetical protein
VKIALEGSSQILLVPTLLMTAKCALKGNFRPPRERTQSNPAQDANQEDFRMLQALNLKMPVNCAQLVSIPTLELRNASIVLKVECQQRMERQNVLHASMELYLSQITAAVRNAKLGESRCLVQQSALHVTLVLSQLRRG